MSLRYRVEFSSASKKQLKKSDKKTIKRIIDSIESLIESPYNHHPNSKKMKGYEGNIYRLRVGDNRIIYEIFDDKVLVFVVKIGSRGMFTNKYFNDGLHLG